MQAFVKEQITADSLEVEYSKFTSIEHRKKFAQFFTPLPIAELMAKWIFGNADLKTVLEPAFGLGIFSRAILSKTKNVKEGRGIRKDIARILTVLNK